MGLKTVIKLDGQELYSSDTLKRKFIEAVAKTGRGKKIVPSVERMIQNKTLIPTFANKNVFQLVRKKIFPDEFSGGALGMYVPKHRFIIICMEPNTTFGFAKNDLLVRWTIHEGMHKLAKEEQSTFKSFFKHDLEKYYTAVFKRLFSLQEDPKDIGKIVDFLCKSENSGRCFTNSGIMAQYKMLDKSLINNTTLSEKEFEDQLRSYTVMWKLYHANPYVLRDNLNRFMHIYRALAFAYKDVWGKVVHQNFYGQEIAMPSEVIAIRSEIKTDSKVYQGFSKLK